MNQSNQYRFLFFLCCVSLTVTSMTFGIRAGILTQLSLDFGLSGTELGWVNAMAFLGFPCATIVGGIFYNTIGAKKLLSLAFVCHLFGLVLTIFAEGFWGLIVSTFLIGFANGSVEAGCNPLVAALYQHQKTTMLNKLHVWFPGGIVIGALSSNYMSSLGFDWQWQVALIILPTLMYGVLLLRCSFPKPHGEIISTKANLRNFWNPLYFLLLGCMTITATTELGTQQWIEKILGASGASPMLILAMITGIMAVGRYFAGPLVKRINPSGILLASAVVSSVGIHLMSIAHGDLLYVAAIIFALGVMYFWPTMLGSVAEYTPKTGALGLSVVGGAGMFAVSMWNPVIGTWIDEANQKANAQGLSATAADVMAGQTVLSNLLVFPLSLIVLFTVLFFFIRTRYSIIGDKDNA